MDLANQSPFTCSTCHAPHALYELIAGRCHACTAAELERVTKTLAHIYELAMTEDGLADFDADSIRDAWKQYAPTEELESLKKIEQATRDTIISIRDSVLHQRHQLEGYEVDSDIINAVLGIIDDATAATVPPAPL